MRGDTSSSQDGLPVDRGWAWIIAFASAGINLIHGGTHAIFGLLKLEMENAFEDDCPQEVTLWVLSAASTFMLLAGTAVTPLLAKFSHRSVGIGAGFLGAAGLILTAVAPNCYFMFFSLSTVYAAGTGVLDMIAITVFAPYFKRHRALAVGIVGAGAGVGGVACPQLVTFLFEKYSFRGALICYSGLYMNAVVLCALLKPVSSYRTKSNQVELEEMAFKLSTESMQIPEQEPKPQKRGYNWKLWCNPKALVLATTLFFAQNGKGLINTITPSYGEEFSVPSATTATVISVTYTFQIATRILNGWFADRKIIPALLQFALIFITSCISAVVAALVPGLTGVCVLYIVMSLFGTSIVSLSPIVIIELVGVENIETMTGINNVFESASFISNAFIANALFGAYDTWIVVYYFIAGCFLISSASGVGLYVHHHLLRKIPHSKDRPETELTQTPHSTHEIQVEPDQLS